MELFPAVPPDRRKVLLASTLGFALVVLTLGVAAILGFRGSRAIESSAAQLIGDHLQMVKLVDELQTEQQRLGTLLLQLSQGRRDLRAEIDAVERSITENAEKANRVSPSTSWGQVKEAARMFAVDARLAIVGGHETNALHREYDRFVELIGTVVKETATRSAVMEQEIEVQSKDLGNESVWLLGACFLLAILSAGASIWITNQAFLHLEEQTQTVARVSWHMLQGQEVAARRFAHEMHDELGQSLTGLQATLIGMKPEDFGPRRGECVELLDEAIDNVRELSQLLRPVILDDFGLDAGLRWLAERFGQRTRIAMDYESNRPGRLEDETETHLFRITQEALTNIARHSGATAARVRFRLDDQEIRLTVEDNGHGIDPRKIKVRSSLGMVGMRARAQRAGGGLAVEKSELGGVKISVVVPLPHLAEDNANEENSHLVG